jgi:hypothetical protein
MSPSFEKEGLGMDFVLLASGRGTAIVLYE